MKYQIIINLLDNTPNQPSKFRIKNRAEVNNCSRGMYDTNSQIKCKTSMQNSSLCDYSDGYILVKETITITGRGADEIAKQADERDKKVTFENCATYRDCKSEVNNTQAHNTKGLDVVMMMYNLIEYIDNYSKTLGNLWQYYRDKQNDTLTNSEPFKSKIKISRKSPPPPPPPPRCW